MSRRAQLVVLAAATVALALVPMAAAYLQLGYQADLRGGDGQPLSIANATLTRAVDDITASVPERYDWGNRSGAKRAVARNLTPWEHAVENASADRVTLLARDNRTATRLARRDCPGGPNREFGRCVARGGIVVQNRTDRTHVVAVAFSVHHVGQRERANATLVVRA